MKTRSSVSYRRNATYRRNPDSWLASAVPIGFALLPLGVMLWVVPQTGLGFA